MSIHLHIRKDKETDNTLESEMALRAAYIGKPVVIEEFTLLTPREETAELLDRFRSSASGYMGYYWGESQRELEARNTIRAGITADHIEMITTVAEESAAKEPTRAPGSETFLAKIVDIRLDPARRKEAKDWYEALVNRGAHGDFRLE